MEKQLNQLLADFVVEYHKLQNFHWYVKGKDFFTVHAKLEEWYDAINGAIDEVAEMILMLKMEPLASLKEFMEVSRIKEADGIHRSSADVFKEVKNDFSYLLESVAAVKKNADEKDVYMVSALMDDYIKEFSKSIWMLEQVVD